MAQVPIKKELQSLAGRLNLQNVNFMPLQEYSKFNDFLNLADIHLVIQKASASDLVMPSKLTTILAVGGVAIITANPGSGLHSLVKDHDIGVLVEAENTNELKMGILRVIQGDAEAIGRNARKYAEEYLTIDKVLLSYEESIQRARVGYAANSQLNTLPLVAGGPVSKVSAAGSKNGEPGA